MTTTEYRSVIKSLSNMNESQNHYVEQKTPDTRECTLCDIIHINFNKQNKYMSVDMGK